MPRSPVEIPLVVSGVDLGDDRTVDIIAEHLDDLLWTQTTGVVTATVFADEDAEPLAAALEAAARIMAALDAATVTHVAPDLVSTTMIADRVGVSRQAVRKWATGPTSTPFPQPYGVLDGDGRPVRVWRWVDVLAWLTATKGWAADVRVGTADAARIDALLSAPAASRRTWRAAPYTPPVVWASARRTTRVSTHLSA